MAVLRPLGTLVILLLTSPRPLAMASLHLTHTRATLRRPRLAGLHLPILLQAEDTLLEVSILTPTIRAPRERPMGPHTVLQGENSMGLRGETSTIVAFHQTERGEVEALAIKGGKIREKDTELSLFLNQNVLLL